MALAKLKDGELIQDEKDLLYAIEKHMGYDVKRLVENLMEEKQDEIDYLEKQLKYVKDEMQIESDYFEEFRDELEKRIEALKNGE